MLIYQYSGGLDGFLSVVFRAYQDKALPDLITDGTLTEPPLRSRIVPILPDEAKALRVEKGIYARLGITGLRQLGYAYASYDPERNKKIFYWILSVFKYGDEIQNRYQDPNVMEFWDMTARVTLEINRMLGFLQFSQGEEGLYWTEFSPDNNILPFLIPHFIRRFNEQPFLIFDCKRSLYGIYNGKEWKVLHSNKRISFSNTNQQEVFQRLWKQYYRSVTIASQENLRLQDAYLPRRYRVFLTEFRDCP